MYPETKKEYLDKWVKEGHLYWKSPNDVIKINRRTNNYITYTKGKVERDNYNGDWYFKRSEDEDNRYIRRIIRIHDGVIIVPYDSEGKIEFVGSFEYDPNCFYGEFPEQWDNYEW